MADTGGLSQAHPGAVVKEERLRRGWTLADASERTGLPISTLSKVENDKISLSYDKLVKLSEGLEIDISRLFGGDDTPVQRSVIGRRSVTRRHEGRAIETPSYNHRYLAADLLSKIFIPVVADIKIRSLEEFGELVTHSGEEFAYVLEGTVDLYTALYAPVRLNVGDSIYFDSAMGHAYIAASEGVCRVLSICTGPEAQLQQVAERKSVQTKFAPPTRVPAE
ncbi:MAG: XRE family transcriptional regulator [Hyphomonadaceae bacterium]